MYFDHNLRSKSRTKHTGKKNRLFDCVAVIRRTILSEDRSDHTMPPLVSVPRLLFMSTQGHVDETKENGNEACFFGIQVAY